MPSLATVMQQLSTPASPAPVTKPAPRPATPKTPKHAPVVAPKPVAKTVVKRDAAVVVPPASLFGLKKIVAPKKQSDLFN
jgi:hypothetical protein